MQAAALETVARTTTDPATHLAAVKLALILADEAEESEHYEGAEHCAQAAQVGARVSDRPAGRDGRGSGAAQGGVCRPQGF